MSPMRSDLSDGRSGEQIPKYAYFPFGGGPRQCIGNYFAMMEVVLLLATIGQQFRFALDPSHKVEVLPVLSLRPKDGIKVIVKVSTHDSYCVICECGLFIPSLSRCVPTLQASTFPLFVQINLGFAQHDARAAVALEHVLQTTRRVTKIVQDRLSLLREPCTDRRPQ